MRRRDGRTPVQRRSRSRPVVAVALLLLGLVATAGLLAPWLAPHDPVRQDLRARLAPPTGFATGADGVVRPLGSDHLGRDVASRTLHAIRTSIGIATAGTLVGALLGSLLGLASGMAGGRLDEAVMFVVDVQMALPFVLLALVAIAVFGTHPLVLIAVVGLSGWDGYARVVRGQVLSTKRAPYVEAVRALGAPTWTVAARHVLPNVSAPVLVLAGFNFTSIVLLESSLSFLGLGVQPPGVSLGLLIAYGREYLPTAPWMALAPAAVLVVVTLSVGIVADALRDQFDPRTA